MVGVVGVNDFVRSEKENSNWSLVAVTPLRGCDSDAHADSGFYSDFVALTTSSTFSLFLEAKEMGALV